MQSLVAISEAITQRLKAEVKPLRGVDALQTEEQLEAAIGTPPFAFTLLRGARFEKRAGSVGPQKGESDVMVWLRCKSVAHATAAAATQQDGAYQLLDATVAALNGFAPVQDHALQLAEWGFVKMKSNFEVTVGIRFSLILVAQFGRPSFPSN